LSELLKSENSEISREFHENISYFYNNYEKIKQEFSNKLIAINNRQIIDSDNDIHSLVSRLREKYGDIRKMVIRYVGKEDIKSRM
jgi:Family of unknown function (DUF5678)